MGLFDELARSHEHERHLDILSRLPRWRPKLNTDDGFVSPERAAETMGVSLGELREMVATGLLQYRDARGELLVRPVVARVIGVKV